MRGYIPFFAFLFSISIISGFIGYSVGVYVNRLVIKIPYDNRVECFNSLQLNAHYATDMSIKNALDFCVDITKQEVKQ